MTEKNKLDVGNPPLKMKASIISSFSLLKAPSNAFSFHTIYIDVKIVKH